MPNEETKVYTASLPVALLADLEECATEPRPIGQQHPFLRRGRLHSGVASNAVPRARRVHCEPHHGGSARCESRESVKP